jgi:hypothetical protein
MKKKILIVGGGLSGCMLAYMLSKKKYDVTIFEKNKTLISSYNPVKIGRYKINNGFHGIELPRANKIYNFFKSKLKIKFKILPIKRLLLIQRQLIDYKLKYEYWPKNIILKLSNKQKYYKNQKIQFYFKKDIVSLIKLNSKKFFGNINESKNQFLPWFLPSDIRHMSKDEGDKFRSQFRNNKIRGNFAIPRQNLFNVIKKNFYTYLKSKKVKIVFNSDVVLEKKKIIVFKKNKKTEINYNKIDKVYHTLSAAFLVRHLNFNHFKKINKFKKNFFNCLIRIDDIDFNYNFSEILTLNEKIWFVNKVYSLNYLKSNLKKSKYIIAEVILEQNKLDQKKIKIILSEIKKIFNLEKNPKMIDWKMSRVVFFLTRQWIQQSEKMLKIAYNSKKIYYNSSFYPINMNKVWLQCEKLLEGK